MPGLVVPFTFFSLLYVALSVAVVWLMRRQILKSPDIEERPPLAVPLPQGA
jgi:cytochrome bd-type quinol oxidase subunit 1